MQSPRQSDAYQALPSASPHIPRGDIHAASFIVPTAASERQQIRQLQLVGASLFPLEEVIPGDAVRITEGHSPATRGSPRAAGRRDRLVVQVSLLRKTVAVEFEPAVLKRPRRAGSR